MKYAFIEDKKVVQLVVTPDPAAAVGGKECSDEVQLGWDANDDGTFTEPKAPDAAPAA